MIYLDKMRREIVKKLTACKNIHYLQTKNDQGDKFLVISNTNNKIIAIAFFCDLEFDGRLGMFPEKWSEMTIFAHSEADNVIYFSIYSDTIVANGPKLVTITKPLDCIEISLEMFLLTLNIVANPNYTENTHRGQGLIQEIQKNQELIKLIVDNPEISSLFR